MTITRNLIGSLLALIAAAAAVYSTFVPWFNSRNGNDFRLEDLLWNGITTTSSGLWVSLFLPMLAAAILTLVGVVLRMRTLVMFAGLIVAGFTVLWLVREGLALGTLSVGETGVINRGVAFALGSSLLLFLSAGLMAGRRKRRAHGRAAPVGDDRVHSSAHIPLSDRGMAGARGRHGDEGMGTAAAAEHPPEESGRVRRLGLRRHGHGHDGRHGHRDAA
jgi:hypothetical protein